MMFIRRVARCVALRGRGTACPAGAGDLCGERRRTFNAT